MYSVAKAKQIFYFGGDFMSFFDKIAGYGSMDNNIEHQICDYLLDDENVIMAFTFIRDSIALSRQSPCTVCITIEKIFKRSTTLILQRGWRFCNNTSPMKTRKSITKMRKRCITT